MIVIDVGCATWGGDESVTKLIAEFDPDVFYGFDPSTGLDDVDTEKSDTTGRPAMRLFKAAAWTHDGTVNFREANLGGKVDPDGETVECVDLARFILDLPADEEIVLKIDAEGAEYDLLPHLIAHDADIRLTLCLVEYHCDQCGYGSHPVENCPGDHAMWVRRRDEYEAGMRCEMREWNL